MIGRKRDPQDASRTVFVPLAYEAERDVWVSLIQDEGGFPHGIEAGRICIDQLKRWYASIAAHARMLRVICEHPEFDFSGDAIDSDMIRDAARKLSTEIAQAQDDLSRLLDEPSEDDRIWFCGVSYAVDPNTRTMEPIARTASEELDESPDLLFLRLVSVGLRHAYQATQQHVSQKGITDVIGFLNRLVHDREPVSGADGHEASGNGGDDTGGSK